MSRRGRSAPRRGGRPERRPSTTAAPAISDVLVGRNPLREVLRHAPGRIRRVFVARVAGDDSRGELLQLARSLGVVVEEVPAQTLDRLAPGTVHQGFVAELGPPVYFDVDQVIEQNRDAASSLVVALDELQDPHNMGAILRAAECFGADGLVWSKNRGCQVTATVRKVSVGASELVPLVRVANVVEALRRFRAGEYTVVGADIGEGAVSVFEYQFSPRTVLVLGSEGEGLKRLVKESLDARVYIPMAGAIDSLNVSQAAAVLMARYRDSHSHS